MSKSLTTVQLDELRKGNGSFGSAVEALKIGKKVARSGWNGKGMFAFFVEGSIFKVNRKPLNEIYEEGTEVTYRPHIDLKAVDGSVGVWNPNMMDILAEDWMILEDSFVSEKQSEEALHS